LVSTSESKRHPAKIRISRSAAKRGRGRTASKGSGEGATEKRPTRTCASCREMGTSEELVRFVLGPDGTVGVDLAGGAFGRGSWLHPTPKCLRSADKSLGRAFEEAVVDTTTDILGRLLVAAERRTRGLLLAARRSRHLALGVDTCSTEWNVGRVVLVMLASDVGSLAHAQWVEDAVAKGSVIACFTRAQLGEMLGRGDVAAVGLLDSGLGRSLRRTLTLTIQSRSILSECRIVERSEAG
jgi:uncharacterized protein